MNVADLDNCKELYRLSGWGHEIGSQLGMWHDEHDPRAETDIPRYDAGYLLRKLGPESRVWKELGGTFTAVNHRIDEEGGFYRFETDTPENALCQLAIELFKAGVLTREEK